MMLTMKKILYLTAFLLLSAISSHASVVITEQGGWFESAYVTWQKATGLTYNVYVSPASSDAWTQLDKELVREYPSYGRADALGLSAGSYKFKIVPVSNGTEVLADAATSEAVAVKPHDRSGFAHKQAGNEGIGAYNNDGTLKDNARVLYVWANNAKTVSMDVVTSSNGKSATFTGLQQIIYGYQKGDANGSFDRRPLCVRIIGTIRATDMDEFLSSEEGLQIKGAKAYMPMNITIEGVGNDANVWGFGFLLRNTSRVELRNFGIMYCMDDCVSIDTDNSMIWVHNLDLFYGQPGGDADQAKGDGTIDMKGDSQYLTISYNHFYDSGKSSLCGMKSETGPNWITYHHNWFDHSDSRHPRIRTMSVHVYNNYFDGNSKYGVGAAYQSNAFVENNYFRNCKYPMLTSMQGSDIASDGTGTFSGEDGGVIKSFGNHVTGARSLVTYQQNATEYDCWEATNRNDQVPSTVKAKQGGKTYSNFDTDASIMYAYTPDAASDIPTIVSGTYGAGRMQHGDFNWTFDNSVEDTNSDIISGLKSAIQNYQPTLVGIFGGSSTGGGGQSEDDPEDDPVVDPNATGEFLYFPDGSKTYNAFFTITGNTTNSYGSTTYAYKGQTMNCNYTLKLESSTSVKFKPAKDGIVKIALSTSGKNNLKLNGTKVTGDSNNIVEQKVSANTQYEITKADKAYIYYIELTYDSSAGIHPVQAKNAAQAAVYDLQGRRITKQTTGMVYIQNGKKYISR